MKVCNVAGIPNKMSLRQWLSIGTLLARTVAMTCEDTTRVVQLLATAAENIAHNRHCHSLLASKGNVMN